MADCGHVAALPVLDVCFGSKADIGAQPESGRSLWPLWVRSGHGTPAL